MATAQRQPQQQRPEISEYSGQDLLKALLDKPINERHRSTLDAMLSREETIEQGLPNWMKGEAKRLVRIAMMTMLRTTSLQACPPQDFIRCVIEAAQFGFAIDNKMAYVVNYKSTYQMQLSYMGLIAALKRCGNIGDVRSDVVADSDHFRASINGGTDILEHEYKFGTDRKKIIGAYSRIRQKDGLWTFETMDKSELDRIQARAPAKNGPWSTDVNEMRKKTVIRRHLKMYMDDPGVARIIPHMGTDDDDSLPENKSLERPTLASLAAPQEQHEPPALTFDEAAFYADLNSANTRDALDAVQAKWEPVAGDQAGKVAGECAELRAAMKGGA